MCPHEPETRNLNADEIRSYLGKVDNPRESGAATVPHREVFVADSERAHVRRVDGVPLEVGMPVLTGLTKADAVDEDALQTKVFSRVSASAQGASRFAFVRTLGGKRLVLGCALCLAAGLGLSLRVVLTNADPVVAAPVKALPAVLQIERRDGEPREELRLGNAAEEHRAQESPAAPTAAASGVREMVRQAVDLLLSGDGRVALEAYRVLAAAEPQREEYRLAVRLLHDECEHGGGGRCK